jgi:hypothetical protein
MFMVSHAAVGALIGAAVPNSYAAFSLGFLSHFVLDMIPHGDEMMLENYKSGKKSKARRAMAYVTMDAIITAYAIMAILSSAPASLHGPMKWGIVGSILPDLLVGAYEVTKVKWLRGYVSFHHRNHHRLIGKLRQGRDIPFNWGLAYQIAGAILLLKVVI